MKKIILLYLVLLLLLSISAYSAKESFKEIMVEHKIDFDSVWHYEVKENVIIVLYEKEQNLHLGFIR